ncbi:hypothetical protein ACN27F_10750 [Solwaraspora sp. WMMB335]|uniref:hypothetical protein n=1 Tax=Solwaraspora sp. WMMB335 TaxID=3404118 RepID=UPI003B94B560
MTAQGKKTTTRLVRGDRILITDDVTKSSTRTRGDWHPSRIRTGVTVATVLGKEAVSGRRTRYNVVTDAGMVLDLSGGQTFLLAPAAPSSEPTGEAPGTMIVPDALINEQEAADALRRVLERGWTPIRLLTPIQPVGQGHGHVKGVPFGAGAPADRDWWGAIVRALHYKRPLNDGEIYQIWTGQVWEALPSIADVTRAESPGGAQ